MAKMKYVCTPAPSTWLPPAINDSKCWMCYAKSSLFVSFPLGLIFGFYFLFSGRVPLGEVLICVAAVSVILILLTNPLIMKSMNEGRFGQANRYLKCFTAISLFCMIFPGFFYFIAYKKMQPVFKPQTQRYPTNYYEGPRSYPPNVTEGEEMSPEEGFVISKK